ncbi:MAG: VanZ family protein [Chthoniobacteraceae bacterium]
MNNRYPSWLVRASWLAVIFWASTIFYLSSLSGTQIERMGIHLWDKAAHFLAFFTGGVVLSCALRFSTGWTWLRIGLVGALAIAAYAATDEYHQLSTPYRSGGDLLDWLADALGGTFGTAFTILTYALVQRSNRPAPAGN